jgi:hypothetical protein
MIDNLQPDTGYYYRLRYRRTGDTEYGAGDEYNFHTQRPPGGAFTFGVGVAPKNAGQTTTPASFANTNDPNRPERRPDGPENGNRPPNGGR